MNTAERIAGVMLWTITILIVSIGVFLGLVLTAHAQTPVHVKPKGPSHTHVLKCGIERWDVKTLSDPASSRVSLTPNSTTVQFLATLPGPVKVGIHQPRGVQSFGPNGTVDVELHVWEILGTLQAYKLEADMDYHLIIADPANPTITLIAEIPSPSCSPAGYQLLFRNERAWVDKHFGIPTGVGRLHPVHNSPLLSLTGVGFFDILDSHHLPTGHAQNGIELHPVLSIGPPQLGTVTHALQRVKQHLVPMPCPMAHTRILDWGPQGCTMGKDHWMDCPAIHMQLQAYCVGESKPKDTLTLQVDRPATILLEEGTE